MDFIVNKFLDTNGLVFYYRMVVKHRNYAWSCVFAWGSGIRDSRGNRQSVCDVTGSVNDTS